MRITLVLLASFVGWIGCQSDSDPLTVGSDPLTVDAEARLSSSEGGQLLLDALNAHGGLDAWHAATTSAFVWEFFGNNFLIKSRMVAHNRTRQIYHDLLALGSPDAPVTMQARMAWDGTDAWVSPDSTPTNPRFWATTAYYFQSIPFVLADPGLRYELLPNEDLDGTEHRLVKCTFDDGVGDSPGDHYTLYVHPTTNRVSAIRYNATFGRGRPAPDESIRETLFYYLDYETIDGLTVPTRFEGYEFNEGVRGDLRTEAIASEISFTAPFDSTKLVMPPDGRIQPMPSETQ